MLASLVFIVCTVNQLKIEKVQRAKCHRHLVWKLKLYMQSAFLRHPLTLSDLDVLECSCSAPAVPFNQRLVSSTPATTPQRKKLVERHGVLMLDGSTETQILNATDTVAAVRPPSPARPSGPCLSRGDVQFAAAPHQSSSSTSVSSSTSSCDGDVGPAAYPLYSLASNLSVPYRCTSIPCWSTAHCTGWQAPSTSQPVIYTSAGSLFRPVSTSLASGVDFSQHAPPVIARHAHSGSGGLHGTVPTSGGFAGPQSSLDHPVRLSQAWMHTTVPCSCTHLAASTNVASTAVASDRPAILTASSSQETIEIHLESSPGRSAMQERFTVVRGTVADGSRRRRPKKRSTVRDRQASVNGGRRQRCRNTADDSDTERLMSLLRQLKAVVMANRNPEITRLLSEVCDAARMSPVLPASQATPPPVDDLSPTVEQLQSEVVQLNR